MDVEGAEPANIVVEIRVRGRRSARSHAGKISNPARYAEQVRRAIYEGNFIKTQERLVILMVYKTNIDSNGSS